MIGSREEDFLQFYRLQPASKCLPFLANSNESNIKNS